MCIFSKSKKKDELVVVFDIGSSSVGGAAFYPQKNGIPKIVFSIREPIKFEEKLDFDKFSALAIKTFEIVVNKIYLAKLGAPSKIFCVLLSPWYASQTRTISFGKKTPFVFTNKLADNLIQNEIKLFEEEHLSKYSSDENSIRSIEFKNIKTMLNGYPISNPIGQKAQELEMSFFISMSPEEILNKIEDIIIKYFHFKNIKFSSFTMTVFSVVRDTFIYQKDFLLIDISGEMTDISMVKNDILCESISFPIGCNYMVRGISEVLNCTLNEAKDYLSLYKDKHMIESLSKKIEPIINRLKVDWLRKFQDSLVDLSNNISIPSTIFLTTDKDLADFFLELIKNEEFNQYAFTESKFKVVLLNTQALHGTASFKEDTNRDPFLTIESVYVNRFLNSKN